VHSSDRTLDLWFVKLDNNCFSHLLPGKIFHVHRQRWSIDAGMITIQGLLLPQSATNHSRGLKYILLPILEYRTFIYTNDPAKNSQSQLEQLYRAFGSSKSTFLFYKWLPGTLP